MSTSLFTFKDNSISKSKRSLMLSSFGTLLEFIRKYENTFYLKKHQYSYQPSDSLRDFLYGDYKRKFVNISLRFL